MCVELATITWKYYVVSHTQPLTPPTACSYLNCPQRHAMISVGSSGAWWLVKKASRGTIKLLPPSERTGKGSSIFPTASSSSCQCPVPPVLLQFKLIHGVSCGNKQPGTITECDGGRAVHHMTILPLPVLHTCCSGHTAAPSSQLSHCFKMLNLWTRKGGIGPTYLGTRRPLILSLSCSFSWF